MKNSNTEKNELKKILGRMAVYYLFLAVNIIPCAGIIPDVFPTRNVSNVYLLTLCFCLVLYYSHRVSPTGALSVFIKLLSWMCVLLILLRGIKYSAFSSVGVLARHTWYLYYVPMLMIPLFLFYISLLVSPKERRKMPAGWYIVLALTILLIVLVLTNDLHQLVYSFKPGYDDWDSDYERGWLFYVINGWQYGLYLAGIIILVVKSGVSSSKKNAWIILIPFGLGIVMNVLLFTGKMPTINGSYILEFPESMIFTAAVVLECCMYLGLIPTNTDYGKLFKHISISAQITDDNGNVRYTSNSEGPMSYEQFKLPEGARIDNHKVLHRIKIPGGYGFWRDDLTELDRLNDELNEAKEELLQEAELTRLRGELKEKQTKIEQRSLVYDTIASKTQKQSKLLSALAKAALDTKDGNTKEEYRRKITLLGAYIKRYANLMLISRESSFVEAGELGLSVSEVLRYLNFCGIPGEFYSDADCKISALDALNVFEAFETLLESYYSCLSGLYVNLSEQENLFFKLTIETNGKKEIGRDTAVISSFGLQNEKKVEENITYICFTLPKGGEKE